MSRLRIALDLSVGKDAWLGGLYYLENLVLALRTLPDDEQPDLRGLAPVDDPDFRREIFRDLLPLVDFRGGRPRTGLVTKLEYRARLLLDRREPRFGADRTARAVEADVLFPTLRARVRPTAHVPWIYDVQHYRLPENFSDAERRWRGRAFRRAAVSGDLVVVSSAAAATEVAARLPEAEPRLRVLRFTTVPKPEWFDTDPEPVVAKYDLPPRFLMCPGQLWVHKNHLVAFEAVRQLRDAGTDVCLVCTGATDDYRAPAHFDHLRRFVDENRLQRHIRILGILSRSEYFQLLRVTAALVEPSLFEGWSSIVEDGRALGKHMLLSDIDVHLEQSPPQADYFPRYAPDALAAAIERVLAADNPGLELEDALDRQADHVRTYARSFLAIAEEAARVARRPSSSA